MSGVTQLESIHPTGSVHLLLWLHHSNLLTTWYHCHVTLSAFRVSKTILLPGVRTDKRNIFIMTQTYIYCRSGNFWDTARVT